MLPAGVVGDGGGGSEARRRRYRRRHTRANPEAGFSLGRVLVVTALLRRPFYGFGPGYAGPITPASTFSSVTVGCESKSMGHAPVAPFRSWIRSIPSRFRG